MGAAPFFSPLPRGEGAGEGPAGEGHSDAQAPACLNAPHPPPPSPQGRRGIAALLVAAFAVFALPSPAYAQARTEAVASHHAVNVQRITSPHGIEAWLVSDSTVPMIVMRAYWRGGSAIEPQNVIGVTSVMTDMLT